MRVSVISAERSVFDGKADAVVAPAFDGLEGFCPACPFMTLLGEGIVKINRSGGGGAVDPAECDGGFLQVASNVVRIVARRAGPADS